MIAQDLPDRLSVRVDDVELIGAGRGPDDAILPINLKDQAEHLNRAHLLAGIIHEDKGRDRGDLVEPGIELDEDIFDPALEIEEVAVAEAPGVEEEADWPPARERGFLQARPLGRINGDAVVAEIEKTQVAVRGHRHPRGGLELAGALALLADCPEVAAVGPVDLDLIDLIIENEYFAAGADLDGPDREDHRLVGVVFAADGQLVNQPDALGSPGDAAGLEPFLTKVRPSFCSIRTDCAATRTVIKAAKERAPAQAKAR